MTQPTRFEGRVWRPPGEAWSTLLQLTVGCSHNRCAFCMMYREKRYRVRPLDEVFEDIDNLARHEPNVHRVFICDGDALSAGFDTFAAVCERLNERFTGLNRIAAYVNPGDLLDLSDTQLHTLRSLRFSLGYLGFESGSAEVLDLVRKGATPTEMVDMVDRAREFDIRTSVIGLLGVGGRELSADHVAGTFRVLNRMQPSRLSFLTTMIVPNTPMMNWVGNGSFEPLTERENIRELRDIVAGLELNGCVIRATHRSNVVPVEGRLPKDKLRILDELGAALEAAPHEVTCILPQYGLNAL